MAKKVALYVRVSSARQAAHDVSIPDQIKQAHAYCKKKGWEITGEYIEPGASARNDKRPIFQQMITDSCQDPSPFDIVLVHSLSRFFRDAIQQGLYKRKLEDHGVLLKSITQHFGEGPQADLIQAVIAACDAHNSAETAKHVSRSLIENARQGFWNGSVPPIGYRTYVAEMRGEKQKKKLEIDPHTVDIIKLIFNLFLEGTDTSGPMGIKNITEYLNIRKIKTKTGGDFYKSSAHNILTRTAYIGTYYFNKHLSRTRKLKPREEWIAVPTPPIITKERFEKVQRLLRLRSPKVIPPGYVTSPVLLSGLACCHNCGGRLMIVTGKNGRYRYYSCAKRQLKGKTICNKPASIPEKKLNDIVTKTIMDRVLVKKRVRKLLQEVFNKAKVQNKGAKIELKILRRNLKAMDSKIAILFDSLTDGLVKDGESFKTHHQKLERERAELKHLIKIKARSLKLPGGGDISDQQLSGFAKAFKKMLESGPIEFRKEYMRLLLSRLDVSKKEVMISGPKAALVMAIGSKKVMAGGVPDFNREWWVW